MGSLNGVADGRIENLDPEQLQKLISELREKIIKEVAQSRFHFELAFSFEKKKARAEERLAELGFYPDKRGKKNG